MAKPAQHTSRYYFGPCGPVGAPGGWRDAVHHEVDGLCGSKLDSLTKDVHELGNWRKMTGINDLHGHTFVCVQ